MNESTNNKRIAKNTILLYVRMIFLMLVSLYTSRLILKALGVEDYGIYNIVGGIVAMFTMISGSLSAAISRFLTYELGKGNISQLKIVFSSSITIQTFLSIIFIILAETFGIWFLNEYIVIPAERFVAANWVYQFSIISFVINLISVPYNAAIIAHEKMSAFAIIAILDAAFKLLLAWSIVLSPIDRLIYYAFFLVIVNVITRIIYGIYCNKKFTECNYKFIFDYNILKKMFSFAGWNMIGATSAVFRDHGVNIILNMFFGPSVNAARAITIQVNTALLGFVQNFQMALNPQITKNYASGNIKYMSTLVFQGARLSYYILLFIALPIYMYTGYILTLWLGEYPEHTEIFIKLTLVFSLIESLSGPLITTMYATGKVRNYQIVVGGIQMLNLPFSFLILKIGFTPESVFYIAIIISIACMIARLIMLNKMIGLSIVKYLTKVFINVIGVTISSIILPLIALFHLQTSLKSFLLICILCVVCTLFSELFIGCSRDERQLVYKQLKKIRSRL